jgi:hypothetical protein
MSKEERDLRMAELNELIDELDKSVHCYTPQNPDFCFTVPLPKILKMIASEISDLRAELQDLRTVQAERPRPKRRAKRRSSIVRNPGEEFLKGVASID